MWDGVGKALVDQQAGDRDVLPVNRSLLKGIEDAGGGAYSQVVVVDPGAGPASLVITQPGRGPIVISADGRGQQRMLTWLLWLLLAALILAIATIIVIEVT